MHFHCCTPTLASSIPALRLRQKRASPSPTPSEEVPDHHDKSMGCVCSQPEEPVKPDIPAAPPTPFYRPVVRHSNNSNSSSRPASTLSASTSRGLKRSLSRRSGPRIPTSLPYDTLSSASLVDSDEGNVAYHGLLLDNGKLNLNRAPGIGAGKVFSKAAHPFHDSNKEADATGCTRITGIAMSMPYTIIVGVPNCEKVVSDITGGVFDYVNDFLNGWNPESEIAMINRAKPGKPVPLSSDLAKLFAIVDEMYDLTDGRFDPTTGVVTVAFENCIAENGRPPLPAETGPFKYAVGWKKRLTRVENTITRNNAHTIIDLDGISKGYVIDFLVEGLLKQGFHDCYVDWAGDIRVAGKHPSGRPWRSAVMNPPDLKRVFNHWKGGKMGSMLKEDDIGLFASFSFSTENGTSYDGAIATSGDYFSVQKYGYHHIARPDDLTLMKANRNSVGTICVAAKSCAVADALATAAMTADNIRGAIDFLSAIQLKKKSDIYGFCVVGRNDLLTKERGAFTKDIFELVYRANDVGESESAGSYDPRLRAPGFAKVVHSNTISNKYRFIFRGRSFEIDNFVCLSMEPQQLVTFVVPVELVENASFSQDDERNQFSIEVLSPLSQSEPSKTKGTGVFASLCFRHVSRFGTNALVVSAVEEVNLDAAQPIEVVYKDSFMPKRDVWFGVERSKLQFLSLPELTKILFRQIPSMMWIISTTPAYGGDVAFTATSVAVPESANNVLYFNVSHSSAFFAAFGGIGSVIHAYGLSTRQKQLAERYVKTCDLDGYNRRQIEKDAMVVASCTVEHVDSFQDHLIAVMRIDECTSTDEFDLQPLVWQNGLFLN